MVAGGNKATTNTNNNKNNIVEIIDLETTKSNCPNFPALPQAVFGAAGAFVDNANPIVCGGFDSTIFYKYMSILIS